MWHLRSVAELLSASQPGKSFVGYINLCTE